MKPRIKSWFVAAARLASRLAVVLGILGFAQVAAPVSRSSTGVNEKITDITPQQLDALSSGSAVRLDAGIDAEMVGLSWDANQHAEFQGRAEVNGTWTEWVRIDGGLSGEADPASTATAAQPGPSTAGPAWLGHNFRTVEIRLLEGTPSNLRMHALDTDQPTSGAGLSPTPAGAQVAAPFIYSRADWGADESWRCGDPSYAPSVRMAVIHHTASSNNYGPGDSAAIIRGIYQFHTHTNGWCDIGYNFLVDRYGQIFEGRAGGIALPVIGAHAGGFNSYSTGISVIGDYTSTALPQAAFDALVRLTAWKFSIHRVKATEINYTVNESPCNCQRWPVGTVVTLPTITTHRDVDSTDCPGNGIYSRLDAIRSAVWATVAASPDPPTIYASRSAQQVRADVALSYGDPGDVPLMCDFDGDGVDTPVIFRNGWWFVRNSNTSGVADWVFVYGGPGDIPVCGKWQGGRADGPGVFRNAQFYLRNSASTGVADIYFPYGIPSDVPVVGDWNDDGVDTVGVFRGGYWFVKQANGGSGTADQVVGFGDPGDVPVTGDWNGDGSDTLGVYRLGRWYLRNSVTTGVADAGSFQFGAAWDRPFAADTGSGGAAGPGVAINY